MRVFGASVQGAVVVVVTQVPRTRRVDRFTAAPGSGPGPGLPRSALGEATALKWRDVDFDRARIEVKAAVERVNGDYGLGPTKTHETRSVPIPPPVLDLLRGGLTRLSRVPR